jgi:hypothetical protein
MNDNIDKMTVRRVTLADGRYLIFYEFSSDLLQNEMIGAQSEQAKEKSSRETDRGSSV